MDVMLTVYGTLPELNWHGNRFAGNMLRQLKVYPWASTSHSSSCAAAVHSNVKKGLNAYRILCLPASLSSLVSFLSAICLF